MSPEPNSGCWLWTAYVDKDGYGQITYKRKPRRAHRMSWMAHNKKQIPSGMHICHRCDVPSCVNPDHLFLGTPADNHRDSVEKGRNQWSKDPVGSRAQIATTWRKGEEHCQAKLRDVDIPTIRADNRLLREIAEDYGVSQNTIWQVKARKSWQHIK